MDPIFDSQVFADIIVLFGALIRMLGLAGIGLAVGWVTLEFLRKGQQAWQLQIAVFLGLMGTIIAMVHLMSPAVSINLDSFDFGGTGGAPSALGMFGLGLVAAVLIWGMKKPKKDEEEKEEKKGK